ncbi:MAG TPA: nitrile hydratase subunit beta [Candidatus Binataceae bacterium]|nr:nitrile hydratase subunit beta [Candidatus Binataceae bacterium]
MNGVHDLGGMHGFGAVEREAAEPVFHADWERRVFAIAIALNRGGLANSDEFRCAIERIAPARYLASSYYERMLAAVETLLAEKRVLAGAGLPGRRPAANSTAVRRARAKFKPGDRVRARNLNPAGHTRLPRYVRGKLGVIRRDHGTYAFPDSNALGAGEHRQHVYSVEFTPRELWGRPGARERLRIDLWEDYLEPAGVASTRRRRKVKR